MNWRKSVPAPVRDGGRKLSVAVGRATAGSRAVPDFVVIGAQRCGTTSLFRALMSHPQVARPTVHKGVNYFDLNYYRGWDWYRGHFPVRRLSELATRAVGPPLFFEASGYYLYHPFAMQRLANDLPDVKVVVMLRDPVERAYSAYEHERARGYEWEDFDTALALEDDRLVGERDRMRRDPSYESFPHRHHSYRHRGQYAEQLRAVLELFSRDRVHVMMSEDFFDDPAAEFARLGDFLGLAPYSGLRYDRYNGRPRSPMTQQTHRDLRAHFRPHDDALAELLGRTPPWRVE